MNTKRGFTLIELLVVIAIIGILSSVVLASLSTARTKSKDAAVKSDMATIVTQAAIYNDTNRTYGTITGSDCSVELYADPNVQSALAGVDIANGGAAKACYANDTTYAVAVTRPAAEGFTPDTVYWCVDSTGVKCGINDISVVAGGACGC